MNAPTKKIENMIEEGLSFFPVSGEYRNCEEIVAGFSFVDMLFTLTFVYDMCGNFKTEYFETVQELANTMREIADLRQWRKYEAWQ